MAVLSAGVDAAGQSKAVIDKDLDHGAINKDVQFDGFCSRAVQLVRLEVTGQRCVGEHGDLGGVQAVQGDGVLSWVVVDVGVFLAAGRGSNGDACSTSGVLDDKLQLVGVAELAGQRELTGTVADSAATVSLGVVGATAETFDDIAGWADTKGAGGPGAVGVLEVAGVSRGCVGRVVHDADGVFDEKLAGQ